MGTINTFILSRRRLWTFRLQVIFWGVWVLAWKFYGYVFNLAIHASSCRNNTDTDHLSLYLRKVYSYLRWAHLPMFDCAVGMSKSWGTAWSIPKHEPDSNKVSCNEYVRAVQWLLEGRDRTGWQSLSGATVWPATWESDGFSCNFQNTHIFICD